MIINVIIIRVPITILLIKPTNKDCTIASDANFETLPLPLHVQEVAHTKKEPCPYTTPSARLASDSRRAQIYQLSLSFPR